MTDVTIGRNEPCPCGSGKKYKRCCGVNAAPKLSAPKAASPFPSNMPGAADAGGSLGGFDPSKADPQMMLQFAQALQRLPKGQLQRLQGLMQRAMSGRDVTAEAAEFERSLPVEFQQMLKSMNPAALMGAASAGTGDVAAEAAPPSVTPGGQMTEEEARAIVAQAAAAGKISEQEAETLLENKGGAEKSGLGKLWSKITGK